MNRTLWTIIGLVLLVAGVAGLLVGYGVLPIVDRQQTLLTPELINTWNRNAALSKTLTIIGGLLVALLGVLLLRGQLHRRGGTPMADLYLEQQPEPTEAPQPDRGGTEVASRALHRALQRDLESDRQVRDAAVRLTGPADHPRLLVRLAVTADADVARLAGHVDQVMHRFVTTSGVPLDLSEVVVRIPSRAPARVE